MLWIYHYKLLYHITTEVYTSETFRNSVWIIPCHFSQVFPGHVDPPIFQLPCLVERSKQSLHGWSDRGRQRYTSFPGSGGKSTYRAPWRFWFWMMVSTFEQVDFIQHSTHTLWLGCANATFKTLTWTSGMIPARCRSATHTSCPATGKFQATSICKSPVIPQILRFLACPLMLAQTWPKHGCVIFNTLQTSFFSGWVWTIAHLYTFIA